MAKLLMFLEIGLNFSSFHRRYRSFGCRPESQAEMLFQVQTVAIHEAKVLWNGEDTYSPGAQLEA